MSMLQYVPLDPNVRARANEAFAKDETGRHQGTLFDAANVLGRRSQVIKDIIKKNPGIASTMDSEGKFDIPWHDRFFAGVTDDDIAKALALKAQRLRRGSQLGQQAEKLGIKYNTQTSESDLRTKVENAQGVKDESTLLLDVPNGGKKLAELKAKGELTPERIRAARTTLVADNKKNDPDAVAARNLVAQQIKASQDSQTFAETQLTYQQSRDAENDRNRWQDRQDQRREAALTRELNAQNNQMQMQLEYARLAQSDRERARDRKDQAIVALMQGLGNLGMAFTI